MELLIFLIVLNRGSKIYYFDGVVLLVKDNVLCFDVPMYNTLTVAVRDRFQYLLNYYRGIMLRKSFLLLYGVKKVDTLTHLNYEVVVDRIFKDFVESHDIWMIELPEH